MSEAATIDRENESSRDPEEAAWQSMCSLLEKVVSDSEHLTTALAETRRFLPIEAQSVIDNLVTNARRNQGVVRGAMASLRIEAAP